MENKQKIKKKIEEKKELRKLTKKELRENETLRQSSILEYFKKNEKNNNKNIFKK